jgi:hypothetical protein
MTSRLTPHEKRQVQRVLLRANEQGLGIAFGLLFGGGLFLATLYLVIKGGDPIGPHLGLLGVYFPGYRVTTVGAFVGFVYAFVVGYAVGRTIGKVYNWQVKTR